MKLKEEEVLVEAGMDDKEEDIGKVETELVKVEEILVEGGEEDLDEEEDGAIWSGGE